MGLAKTERAMAAAGQGCLGKARDDEPVFVLRAQDKFAPMLVETWANLAMTAHGFDTPKVTEARLLAQAMRDWQADNLAKVPD